MNSLNNAAQSFFDRNRIPIAFLLSGIVLLVYSWMVVVEVPQQDISKNLNQEKSPNKILSSEQIILNKPTEDLLGKIIWLEGDALRVGIDSHFGILKEVVLKKTDEQKSVNFSCYNESIAHAPGALHFGTNFLKEKYQNLVHFQKIVVMKNGVSDRVILSAENFDGTKPTQIVKEYSTKGHKVYVKLKVKDIVPPKVGGSLRMFNGSCIRDLSKTSSDGKTSFDVKTVSYTKNDQNKAALAWRFSHLWQKSEDRAEIFGCDWIAMDDRFYLRGLQNTSLSAAEQKAFFYKDDKNIYSGYEIPVRFSQGNLEEVFEGFFTFLPKNRGLLNQIYAENKESYYLIFRQFSFMKILSDGLYSVLVYIYEHTNNYGLSLILVTIFLKLLVFPFARKSHLSMRKMQIMEPRIRDIRQKYKDDSHTASLKLMQLYQQEKINPASGCLGMLLPAPFFIALYSLFQNMVELEGEEFLWIKDLALPDVVFAGYTLPFVGAGIRILPFLVAGSHVLQMRVMPKPVAAKGKDAIQIQMQILSYFLPVLFFCICWGLPSGLVLFWLLQNILSILQNICFLYINQKSV